MAIRFSCKCGKKLQARDEFAGRQMKCPQCKQVLTIPRSSAAPGGAGGSGSGTSGGTGSAGSAGSAAAGGPPSTPLPSGKTTPVPPAVRPATQPNMPGPRPDSPRPESPRQAKPVTPIAEIHFEEVTEVLSVSEEVVILEPDEAPVPPRAGKLGAMPAAVATAAPPTAPAAPPPGIFLTQKATLWRGDDQKLLDPESDRPDPRDRSRWPIKLVAALLVAAAVVALVFFGPGVINGLIGEATPEAKHADLDYVPQKAFAMASARVADLWQSPSLRQLPEALREQLADKMRRKTGLAPSDIERVTVIVFDARDVGLIPQPGPKAAVFKGGPRPGPPLPGPGPAVPPAGQGQLPENLNKRGSTLDLGGEKKEGAPATVDTPQGAAKDGEKKEGEKKDADKKSADKKGADKKGAPKKIGGPPGGKMPFSPAPPQPQSESTSEPQIAILITTVEPYNRRRLEGIFAPDGVALHHKGKRILSGGRKTGLDILCLNDRLFVLATTEAMGTFLDRGLKENDGPLGGAVALARENRHIVVGVNAPKQGLPNLPGLLRAGLGSGVGSGVKDAAALVQVRSLTVAADDGDAVKADVRLRYADPAHAEKAKEEAQRLVDKAKQAVTAPADAKQHSQLKTFYEMSAEALKSVMLQTKGDELQVTLQSKGLTPLAPLLIVRATQPPDRARSMNNLRRIAQAMLAYHKEHQTLPPPAIGAKKGLSWRVALLPYLGHKELYDQFHLDEDWNSEHNQALLAQMPDVYASEVSLLGNDHTFFVVLTGPQTLFHGGKQSFSEMKDGASVTMMVVESAPAVPWTAPRDIPYTQQNPPRLGANLPDVFLAAYADGQVHGMSRNIERSFLHGFVTPNGGELMPPPQGLAPPSAGPGGGRKK